VKTLRNLPYGTLKLTSYKVPVKVHRVFPSRWSK